MRSLPRFSVHNPVLVGLLTVGLLIGGTYSANTLLREMFPEFTPDSVLITTIYPGATPAEVEKGISKKIEEVVKDIEEVEEIKTTIGEGFSSITAVLYNDVEDVDQVANDIKAAIDTIPRDDFPEEAEETTVTAFEPLLPVINISYFGDIEERVLKDVGEDLRDELLAIPGITKVVLQGTRNDEISVDVKAEELIEHRLSFMEIGDAIARANLDLPGGQIKTSSSNISVRTLGEKETAEPIGDIIVRSDDSGKVIRLNEIADVRDTFEDNDLYGRFQAKPAVQCTVFKTSTQDAVDIAAKVKALVAGHMRQPLERDWWSQLKYSLGIRDEVEQVYANALAAPDLPGGNLKTSTNLARFIEGRLDLLKRNGFWGLIFVFLSLLMFLDWRVAFWVMFGLLLSILGTVIAMKFMGISLNLISMFGLIVVLGLLVDDAIVVGERIFTKVEQGLEPKLAAISGAEEVTWPVTCAILTTIVAFLPLLFIEGVIGDFMGVLPVIAMIALAISLFEALTVLPSHLADWLKPRANGSSAKEAENPSALQKFRQRVLKGWIYGNYEKLLRKAVDYRYVTFACLVSALIIAGGMIGGGVVPFVFVQKMDSETITVNLKMPVGTPAEKTTAALEIVEKAAVDLPELDSLYTVVGVQYSQEGQSADSGTHLGQLIIELAPVDERDRDSESILRELRQASRDLPGVNAVKFESVNGGPGGKAVQIEISYGDPEQLQVVAEEFKAELRKYAGVYDIDDNMDPGRPEVQIELLDSARALGMTTQSLATQVRAAFYGLESRKLQRDREDVKIMVRYPESHRRNISDIEDMWVAAPDGTLVPFREVARLKEGRSYASIKRNNQKRTVAVTADVDQAVGNADQINNELAALFPKYAAQYPGMKFDFGGEKEEFGKAFASLKRDFLIAAGMIYIILAALFKSYIQPVIVMTAIPFGLIGAVLGHWVMGYPLTILSLIGLVALTGIVVNDSLILIDYLNRRREEGQSAYEATIEAGVARLRAILLTSITTTLGLAPLLLETSFQARFLIPMGISIAGGVAFATVLTLIGVPCIYLIFFDLRRAFMRVVRFFDLRVEDTAAA